MYMNNEYNNMLHFYNEYKNNEYIIIPYPLYSSKNILLMQYIDGRKILKKKFFKCVVGWLGKIWIDWVMTNLKKYQLLTKKFIM